MSPFLFVNHSSSTLGPSATKARRSKRPSSAVVSYVQKGVQRKRRVESLLKLNATKQPPPWHSDGGGTDEVVGGSRSRNKRTKRKDIATETREESPSAQESSIFENSTPSQTVVGEAQEEAVECYASPPTSTSTTLITTPEARFNALLSPTPSTDSFEMPFGVDMLPPSHPTLPSTSRSHTPVFTFANDTTRQYTLSPPYSSNSPSPSPVAYHGSSDPFCSTPTPLTPAISRLLSFLTYTLPTYWILRDISRFSLTDTDIRTALFSIESSQMINALLAMSSSLIATHLRLVGDDRSKRGDRYSRQHQQTLIFTSRSVEGLRRSLASIPTRNDHDSSSYLSPSLLDQTICTMLFLSRAAGYNGDETSSTLHMDALRRLVAANGGLRIMHPLRAECVVAFDVKLGSMGMRRASFPLAEWDWEDDDGDGGSRAGYDPLPDERRSEFGLSPSPSSFRDSQQADPRPRLARRFFSTESTPYCDGPLRAIIRSLLDVLAVASHVSSHPDTISHEDPIHRWLHLRPVACEAALLEYYASVPNPTTTTSSFPPPHILAADTYAYAEREEEEKEEDAIPPLLIKSLLATLLILWLNLSLDNPILPNIRLCLCRHLRAAMAPLFPFLRRRQRPHRQRQPQQQAQQRRRRRSFGATPRGDRDNEGEEDGVSFVAGLMLFASFLGVMCEAEVGNPLEPCRRPFFERVVEEVEDDDGDGQKGEGEVDDADDNEGDRDYYGDRRHRGGGEAGWWTRTFHRINRQLELLGSEKEYEHETVRDLLEGYLFLRGRGSWEEVLNGLMFTRRKEGMEMGMEEEMEQERRGGNGNRMANGSLAGYVDGERVLTRWRGLG